MGEVGDATCTAGEDQLMVENCHGCGLGAMTGTHEVQEHLICVMHREGYATTEGVVLGEVDGWVAVDVWVEEGFH